MGKLKGCLVFVATPIVLLILLASCIGASVSKITPDVVGKTISVAQGTLKDAGFKSDNIKIKAIDGNETQPYWSVCTQSVAAETKVETTSVIELLVSPNCPKVDNTTKVSETPAPPKVEEPPAVQEPAPVVAQPAPPAPVVAPPAPVVKDITYGSCKDVRAAGAAPIHRGDPGYSSKLDRDGDGIACE